MLWNSCMRRIKSTRVVSQFREKKLLLLPFKFPVILKKKNVKQTNCFWGFYLTKLPMVTDHNACSYVLIGTFFNCLVVICLYVTNCHWDKGWIANVLHISLNFFQKINLNYMIQYICSITCTDSGVRVNSPVVFRITKFLKKSN